MKILQKPQSSKLISVSLISALATGVKMITSFVMAKVIAIKLGPEGLGIIGQLNSFVLIIMTLSTGAITNGVVKYIAQYNDDIEKQNKVIHAAISITLLCTVFFSLVVGIGSTFWSSYIFNGNKEYLGVFLVFGLSLVFYSTFNLFVSILNGLQLYKKFNLLNILTSIVGLIFSVVLIFQFGLMGALYATVTYQSVVFVLLFFFARKSKRFKRNALFNFSDTGIYKGLLSFSMMTLVSTICVPYVQILIRKFIHETCGAVQMGYYEGITRISVLYLTMITTTLSVYYLPRLSELKNREDIKKEVWYGYKIIIPALLAFCIVIYFSRYLVINLVFTNSFTEMANLFLPQLIGDVFKIASWLLAFMMLAKAMTKQFIITEIFFSVSLYIFTILFVNWFGVIGAIYAYTLNYFLYLVTMLILFRKIVFFKQ